MPECACMKKLCGGISLGCRIAIVLLTALGLLFSILSGTSCEYFTFENGNADWLPDGLQEGKVGLFEGDVLPDGSGCQTYPDEVNFDGYMKTARAAVILAIIFGFCTLVLVLFECTLCKFCCSGMIISILFFLSWATQGVSFAVFGTEQFCFEDNNTCSLGKGGIYSIVSICLYFIASCCVCFSPEPEPLIKKEGGCCKGVCCKKGGDEEEGKVVSDKAESEGDKND